MLLTVVGSALGAWWLVTQQRTRVARGATHAQERGTIIFDNTPQASDVEPVV